MTASESVKEQAMTVVEQMARAIAADLAWCSWEETPADKQDYLAKGGTSVMDVNGPFRCDFISMVRAAIKTLRDPPGHIIAAIEAMAEERYNAAPAMQRWYGEDVWNAGIDAILSEPEHTDA